MSDLRDPTTTPLNFTKSINLALSERGINALRHTGLPDLADAVLGETFPMHGRMIHLEKNGEYFRLPQIYDPRGKVCWLKFFYKQKLMFAEPSCSRPSRPQ